MPISVSFSPGTPEKAGMVYHLWGEKIRLSMGRRNFLKEDREDVQGTDKEEVNISLNLEVANNKRLRC